MTGRFLPGVPGRQIEEILDSPKLTPTPNP